MVIGIGNNLTEEELLEQGYESGEINSDNQIFEGFTEPGITIEDLISGDIETLGGSEEELNERETLDEPTENLNWMQENAPEWFSDWLYEAERPNLGGIDLASGFGKRTEGDVTELGSEKNLDRISDLGRGLIQTGAYMGDFWKDLGMLPYNLLADKEKPFSRLWEHPEWAEDIGYESDYGKAVMEDPRIRWMQENLLPYAGPAFFAKTGITGLLGISKQINKIPGLRKLLETVYPTTMKGFKEGLKPAAQLGNIPVNVGLPYLWNQTGRFVKGEPTDYERAMEKIFSENTDFSPISSAYAADAPVAPRPPTVSRHPREMMEMANTRGQGPGNRYPMGE